MREISFFVAGIPRPGGSKRVFPIRKAGALTGKFIVTDAAGQANKDWRASVAHEAKEAMRCHPVDPSQPTTEWFEPWTCAIELDLHFLMPIPKSHTRPKRPIEKMNMTRPWTEEEAKAFMGLRANAPRHHTGRPDRLKLARAVEDALTGILYRDDSQSVGGVVTKSYGARPGVQITMREAT